MPDLIKSPDNQNTTKIDQAQIELGQWFWVQEKPMFNNEKEWLGCVVKIGSNYIEIHEPSDGSSYETIRVHFDHLHKKTRYEENSRYVIQEKIGAMLNRVGN